jgi:hypothetical protein
MHKTNTLKRPSGHRQEVILRVFPPTGGAALGTSGGEGRSPGNHYLPGFFGAPAYLLQYCTRPRFSRVLDLFRGEPGRPEGFSL